MAVSLAERKAALKSHFPGKFPSPRNLLVFRKVRNRQQTDSSLMRFLGYVRPYAGLISGAVLAGILKFTLPASLAVALRFVTDRLVPTGRAEGAHDASYAFTLNYLNWAAQWLPGVPRTPWGQLNILMGTLFVVYLIWGVTFYFRSYLAQLAGHRVI
ncbi:MAG TPA: hypothetical protein VGB77_20550, partial [Abditibacteriaceae bacterium]